MLNELCYEFFREFARYEYCLKITGLRNEDTNRGVKANWDLYAKEVADIFTLSTDPAFADAVDYFLNNPPKKQVIKDGMLNWDDSPLQETNRALLIFLLIRRVRNNLFHGGKFNGKWFAPERSKLLMEHALVILKVCAQSHDKVRQAYEESDDIYYSCLE